MKCLKTTALSRTITFFFAGCLFLFTGATVPVDAKIVFTVEDDIFVMNDDGSRKRRLTQNTTAFDRYPRWSPDGTKIAFTRDMDKAKRQTSSELFLMNADGTDPQRLTHNNVIDNIPSWSPDGRQIAFTSLRSGPWEVYIIDVGTRVVTQITSRGEDGPSTAPDWSPDGRQIVFERFLPIPLGIVPKTIYVMDADGQHQHRVLPDPPLDGPPTFRYFPRWSADGQRILFYESKWLRDGDVKSFIVQQLDGRKQEITDIKDRLGNNFIIAGVSWMENDRAMLFSIKLMDKPSANYNLYKYTFEARGLRRLPSEPSDEKWPDWTEGTLSVSPYGKLTTQWAEIKVGSSQ